MTLNDAGRTVLYAVILGAALTLIAIMRGHFDVAGTLAVVSFTVALIITLATARARRKQKNS